MIPSVESEILGVEEEGGQATLRQAPEPFSALATRGLGPHGRNSSAPRHPPRPATPAQHAAPVLRFHDRVGGAARIRRRGLGGARSAPGS